MKLWIIVVQDEDAEALLPALLEAGFEAYAVANTAGLLRQGKVTVLIAVPESGEAAVRALLVDYAQTRTETRTAGLSDEARRGLGELVPRPVEVNIDGAQVFGLKVTQWERW
jgi:uncharacterized protein YaaQ